MRRICLVAFALMAGYLPGDRAEAAFISTTVERSIASSDPSPGTSGTHFHSDPGQAIEVGSLFTTEEVRGVAEFNLAGQGPGTATLTFSVARIGSSYFGQTGPGNYTIRVVAYAGDNAITLDDYAAPPVATLGSFSTTTLVVGRAFSFDATAGFLAALGSGSLGIRLQVGGNPGNNVANQFSGFQLQTSSSIVPEPAGLVMVATALPGLAGLALRRRRA